MRYIFTALLFFISISVFSQDEKRLALVIGNSNYEKGELKNPVNDARLIASTLDSLDFDVILKENLATKRDMTAAIREFGSKRSEYDVAFVYYAGHGIQVDDENFLLPTKEVFEEEFDVMDYGVSVQNIMRYLKAQTKEVNILILDACRDNPFESNWNPTRSLKGSGLAKIPPPTGSLIAFSTDSGQTAPDGDGENSIYTISLAKNMLLEDTSIDQVFRNVRAEVLSETDGMQRPVEATQLTGQTFYLRINNLEINADDLIEKSFELSKNGNFIEAISKSEEYLELIQDNKNIKHSYDELVVNWAIGTYYNEIDQYDKALKYLGNALSHDDIYWKIAARTIMADVYFNKKENYNVLAQYEKIIELDNEVYIGHALKGAFYHSINDNENSLKSYLNAFELKSKYPNKRYFSRDEFTLDYLLFQIAIEYQLTSQELKAVEYYTKSIEITKNKIDSREAGWPDSLGSEEELRRLNAANSNLALIFSKSNSSNENLLKALDYINEAIKEQEYYEKYINEEEDYFGGNFAIRGRIYFELWKQDGKNEYLEMAFSNFDEAISINRTKYNYLEKIRKLDNFKIDINKQLSGIYQEKIIALLFSEKYELAYQETVKMNDINYDMHRPQIDYFFYYNFLKQKKYLDAYAELTNCINKLKKSEYNINLNYDDITGVNKFTLDIYEIYFLRAELRLLIGDSNGACEDYRYVLGGLSSSQEDYEKANFLIKKNCN